MFDRDFEICDAQGEFLNAFPFGFLDTLDAGQRLLLTEMIAGISERSYRRGFQQGEYAAEAGQATIDIAEWRFCAPLSESPTPHRGYFKSTAKERLLSECGHWLEHAFGRHGYGLDTSPRT